LINYYESKQANSYKIDDNTKILRIIADGALQQSSKGELEDGITVTVVIDKDLPENLESSTAREIRILGKLEK